MDALGRLGRRGPPPRGLGAPFGLPPGGGALIVTNAVAVDRWSSRRVESLATRELWRLAPGALSICLLVEATRDVKTSADSY